MKPYYQDNLRKVFNKDCRDMSELPDESVQMVVTSPPYWGLRKYSGEQELIWGGDNNCEHNFDIKKISLLHENRNFQSGSQEKVLSEDRELTHTHKTSELRAGFCSLCGAWKGAFGLEPTPEMYVQHTIEILREIRRVLRKDGVVFWNIGDSYWSTAQGTVNAPQASKQTGAGYHPDEYKQYRAKGGKPKDLCLIPFRVAIAAQEDGWWVRSVIIWNKPNPMPESVKDRPTESHEYILMLTKSARYYWDQEAVRMPIAESTIERGKVDFGGAKGRDYHPTPDDPNYRDGSEQWGRSYKYNGGGRNIRTVWEFPTKPFPGAHFAVFPEKLPELCIKAATPEVGCCAKCEAPWERILDKKASKFNIRVRDAKAGRATPEEGYKATQEEIDNYPGNHPDPGYSRTIGWRPTCKCNTIKPPVPSLVLDPFMGAGTTLLVAARLGRMAVGYDTSKEYCELTIKRIRQMVFDLRTQGELDG